MDIYFLLIILSMSNFQVYEINPNPSIELLNLQ